MIGQLYGALHCSDAFCAIVAFLEKIIAGLTSGTDWYTLADPVHVFGTCFVNFLLDETICDSLPSGRAGNLGMASISCKACWKPVSRPCDTVPGYLYLSWQLS